MTLVCHDGHFSTFTNVLSYIFCCFCRAWNHELILHERDGFGSRCEALAFSCIRRDPVGHRLSEEHPGSRQRNGELEGMKRRGESQRATLEGARRPFSWGRLLESGVFRQAPAFVAGLDDSANTGGADRHGRLFQRRPEMFRVEAMPRCEARPDQPGPSRHCPLEISNTPSTATAATHAWRPDSPKISTSALDAPSITSDCSTKSGIELT